MNTYRYIYIPEVILGVLPAANDAVAQEVEANPHPTLWEISDT